MDICLIFVEKFGVLVEKVASFCGILGGFRVEKAGFNRGSDDDGVAMIVLLDLGGGVGRDGDELGGALSGAIIGLAERFDKEFETETDEGVQEAEAGVF